MPPIVPSSSNLSPPLPTGYTQSYRDRQAQIARDAQAQREREQNNQAQESSTIQREDVLNYYRSIYSEQVAESYKDLYYERQKLEELKKSGANFQLIVEQEKKINGIEQRISKQTFARDPGSPRINVQRPSTQSSSSQPLIIGGDPIVSGYSSVTGESVFVGQSGKTYTQAPASFSSTPASFEQPNFSPNIPKETFSSDMVTGNPETAQFQEFNPIKSNTEPSPSASMERSFVRQEFSSNDNVPVFDFSSAKETAIDFLAPRVPDRSNSFSRLGLRSPRIFFPQVGALGAVEFGVGGFITGGFTPVTQKVTRIVGESFGLSEPQIALAQAGTTFGLSLVGFSIGGKIVQSGSRRLSRVEDIGIDISKAESRQLSGLVGSGTGSSVLEGEAFVRTKYSIPYESRIISMFPESRTPFNPTQSEVRNFLNRSSTFERGGQINAVFSFERKPIKVPEKIVEPFTAQVYKENLLSSLDNNPQTTFLPLTAQGKNARATVGSQAEVIQSEISKGIETKVGARALGERGLESSEFIVKQTGQLSLRGPTFRSRSFPFQRVTRTDFNPEKIAFGGTAIQSTKSLQAFTLQKEDRSLTRIDTTVPEERDIFFNYVRETPVKETIVSEETRRRGTFTSTTGSGKLKQVRNPVTGELVGYNFDKGYQIGSGTIMGSGGFSQRVFKRSFESGERTGIEFGSSTSRLSGRIGDTRFTVRERTFLRGNESFLDKRARQVSMEKSILDAAENRRIVSTDFGAMQTRTLQEMGMIPSNRSFREARLERFPLNDLLPNSNASVELLRTIDQPATSSSVSSIQTPIIGSEVVRSIKNEFNGQTTTSSTARSALILQSDVNNRFSGYKPSRSSLFNRSNRIITRSRFDNQRQQLSGVSTSRQRSFEQFRSREQSRLGSIATPLVSTRPMTFPTTRPITRGVTRPITRPINRSITTPITRPIIVPATRSLTNVLTQTLSQPITIPLSFPLTVPITKPVTRPLFGPVRFPTNRPSRLPTGQRQGQGIGRVFGQAFSVLYRTRGKVRRLPGEFTRRDAVASAENLLGNTLRASYKIEPRGGIVQERFLKGVPLKGYYNKKGFFVQARGTRLGSRGERSEIQQSKRMRRGFF